MAALALLPQGEDIELPPVRDTSPYLPTVEQDYGIPFPGDKSYQRPPKYVLPVQSEDDLLSAWYAYFSGSPEALNKVSEQLGVKTPDNPREMNLADMLPAIEACAYGELKEC